MDTKRKLEHYRGIWNNCPKDTDIEERAIEKIALLVDELPDDDTSKASYLSLVVDFYKKNDETTARHFEKLNAIVEHIDDQDDRLYTYRVIMRSKHADLETKIRIGGVMLDMLEDA
ncbi:MAG TPA: hypothetical protein VGF14_04970 [Alphaproteobacteria bacterium]